MRRFSHILRHHQITAAGVPRGGNLVLIVAPFVVADAPLVAAVGIGQKGVEVAVLAGAAVGTAAVAAFHLATMRASWPNATSVVGAWPSRLLLARAASALIQHAAITTRPSISVANPATDDQHKHAPP